MNIVLLVVGVLVLGLVLVDVLWTILWVDRHAGPLTSRHNDWTRRLIWRLAARRHGLLSITGPAVVGTSLLIWTLLLWLGWALVFASDAGAVASTQSGAPASFAARVYFIGYTIFTLGNGDYSPQSDTWRVLTAVASMSGFLLLTLCVSYLLSILEAIVGRRAFAAQVLSFGRTPEAFVIGGWDGRAFPSMELQVVSMTEQLNRIVQQHAAYPMLHYQHSSKSEHSMSVATAVFAEALTLLSFGVEARIRPAPSALNPARNTVTEFLDTMRSAYISPAERAPAVPALEALRTRDIPVVAEEEFERATSMLERHRKLLKGFVDAERRSWPG